MNGRLALRVEEHGTTFEGEPDHMIPEKITFDDCRACKGQCCRHVALHIDKPVCKRDYDNIRWYLMHENVSVFKDHDGDWLIEFKSRCRHLRDDFSCDNYSQRPNVCRDYPPPEQPCEFGDADPPHVLLFETAAQFEQWLDARGTDWRWKRAGP